MSFIPFVQEKEETKLLFKDLSWGDIFAYKEDLIDDLLLYIVTDALYYNQLGDELNAISLDGSLVHFSPTDEVVLYTGDIYFPIDLNKFKTTKETM